MTSVAGVDVGKSGGIAYLADGYVEAEPMPLVGKEIDGRGLAEWFRSREIDLVIVERVGAMPGQGVTSMFRFGQSFGTVLGVIEACGLSYRLVSPQTWKRLVLAGTARDKTAAIEYVHRSFPDINLCPGRKRVPHDGMADAVCLAEYGRVLRG